MREPKGFATPEDLGCDDVHVKYDPKTGLYHYTYTSSDANARISFDVDSKGDYQGGIHMVDQSPGGEIYEG
jgi:hypothetical protein